MRTPQACQLLMDPPTAGAPERERHLGAQLVPGDPRRAGACARRGVTGGLEVARQSDEAMERHRRRSR